MFAIAKHELTTLLRSPAAIVIILIFAGGAILQFIGEHMMGESGASNPQGAYGAIALIISMLGYFFVSGLCHDCLNRELKDKTIRLLVSKTSRAAVVWGKFIGLACFWLICVLISFAITSALEGVLSLDMLARFVIYLVFYVAFVEMLSALIPNTRASSFLGVIIGLVFVAGPMALPKDGTLSYLIYLIPETWGNSFPEAFVLVAAAAVCMIVTHVLIERRDL